MSLAYNSYIAIKLKPCANCGVQSRIFSKGLCQSCSMQGRKPIAKISNKRMNSLQEEDIQVLIEECDAVFSKLVRISEANIKGMGECITCGVEKRYQELQCGHFISRQHMMTRWERLNCASQCATCNCLEYGKLDVFEKKLNERRSGLADWLREQSREVWKPSRMELKELLIDLRCQLRIAQIKLIH